MTLDADVIVVGSGPAGSSAAFHLAQRGRRVLLVDRHRFPRDKSCGDGLTRSAVRMLDKMGVLPKLEPAQRTHGVRVFMHGRGSRSFEYPRHAGEPGYGLVVPRFQLDHTLCEHAVEAGATLWEGTLAERLVHASGAVGGVEVVRGRKRIRLRSRFVVAADGATSRLAREAGLVGDPVHNFGAAVRGYYAGVEGLTDAIEIYAPLAQSSDQHLLPSYGWVFPIGPSIANIGVGVFVRERGVNLRLLFYNFLAALRQSDLRFATMKVSGEWMGAPLRFDFAPERCRAPGLLIAGDAAGMISPFTGEGIGFALESGELAARAIDHALSLGVDGGAEREYASALAARYSGYFETGRHSARRYILIWHVLESTFHNDRPLFSICRQAALLPEGITETERHLFPDVSTVVAREDLPLRSHLLAVNEVLLDTVRQDWPFLARALKSDGLGSTVAFRPALLMLASAYSAEPRVPLILAAASALELGCLAILAHVSVAEDPSPTKPGVRRPAHWGNLFALLVGDYLMSHAYHLSAQVAAGVSLEISNALASACEGWVSEIRRSFDLSMSDRDYLNNLGRKAALMFELPCKLGAQLSGSTPAQVDALSGYGHCTGMAYLLADEVLAVRDQPTHFGSIARPEIRHGGFSLPVLRAARHESNEVLRSLLDGGVRDERQVQEIRRLVANTLASREVIEIAATYSARAKAWLTVLPEGPSRRTLAALADFAIAGNVSQ